MCVCVCERVYTCVCMCVSTQVTYLCENVYVCVLHEYVHVLEGRVIYITAHGHCQVIPQVACTTGLFSSGFNQKFEYANFHAF